VVRRPPRTQLPRAGRTVEAGSCTAHSSGGDGIPRRRQARTCRPHLTTLRAPGRGESTLSPLDRPARPSTPAQQRPHRAGHWLSVPRRGARARRPPSRRARAAKQCRAAQRRCSKSGRSTNYYIPQPRTYFHSFFDQSRQIPAAGCGPRLRARPCRAVEPRAATTSRCSLPDPPTGRAGGACQRLCARQPNGQGPFAGGSVGVACQRHG